MVLLKEEIVLALSCSLGDTCDRKYYDTIKRLEHGDPEDWTRSRRINETSDHIESPR